MRQNLFFERINKGEKLIADGATGTNLLQRGLPRGTSAESWVLEKPDQIIQLHRDFITAGAQIILTCTFGANPYRLADSNMGDLTTEINHRAVDLARQAIQDCPVLIAGSMGPLGKLLKPYGPLEVDEAISAYTEQALALTKAGVDLLLIETQFDLEEATSAIHGALTVSNLPIVVSFSFDRGTRTMMGVTPTQMAKELQKFDLAMVGINCGRSLDDNLQALKELRQATNLPIWFKPNAGLPGVDELGNPVYNLTPQKMGEHAQQWFAAGASVIGGCCGTTPEHLAAIVSSVQTYQNPKEERI